MFSNFKGLAILTILVLTSVGGFAIQSKVVSHKNFEDFTAAGGETEDVIVSSDGKITLAQQAVTLAEDFGDAWVINSVVVDSEGVVYLGTSPNGEIFKYDGELEKIYTAKTEDSNNITKVEKNADPNDANDSSVLVEAEPAIANRHIFAMALTDGDKLLAAVSGGNAQLLEYKGKQFEQVAQFEDANYVFALQYDGENGFYAATGPEGKIYHSRPSRSKYLTRLIYDATDKNILSLALDKKGMLYAGSDQRGLVYKINPENETASVVYDSEQTEVTSLVFDEKGNLYAAATSEEVARNQATERKISPAAQMPGRNATDSPPKPSENMNDGLRLKIANIQPDRDSQPSKRSIQANRQSRKGPASHIYKIKKDGLVEDVYSKVALFYGLEIANGKIYAATGNQAELFCYDIEKQTDALIYQDKTASQILALESFDNQLYAVTANPARLLKIENKYSRFGEYISPLIDAAQPAKWGKVHIEAKIPPQTQIKLQARTGNVSEPNDSTFSKWSREVIIEKPIELDVKTARFCQYKLIFKTEDFQASPVVSQVAAAYVVDNIAPNVIAVTVSPEEKQQGYFNIEYNASDENEDTMVYDIMLKKTAREKWITLEKDYEKEKYQLNANIVEDGRYEIKVVADDAKSNSPETNLTGSRISDVFVIDNTPADIEIKSVDQNDNNLKLSVKAADKLSIITSFEYAVNSSDKWKSTLPDDMIFDSESEQFTINLKDLETGVYLISLKAVDSAGNQTYKSVETAIE